MKILVLGGCGRQGSVVASDLAQNYNITIADTNPSADIVDDLSNYKVLRKIMPSYDLVVGALPSFLGYYTIMAAIDSDVNYVDVSFMSQNISNFNSGAVRKNLTILHDCGVAPGLSHLVAGRAIHLGADEISILVGGIAADREDDYMITWSPEDLLEEYTRPARIIIDGEIKTLPALSDQTEVLIPAVGYLKSFYTDGLRSLLSKKDKVRLMEEKTLRWAGHIKKVGPLIYENNFADKLNKLYAGVKKDVVVLKVSARWTERKLGHSVTLVVYGDDKMSAMAKTTALSCSAFVQLVASGKYNRTGVIPPEDVAMDDFAYKFVLDRMSEHNIEFDEKYPFMEMNK